MGRGRVPLSARWADAAAQVHPWLANAEAVAYCQARGIVVEAYGPLGQIHEWGTPAVATAAAAHGVAPPVVLLRWLLQRGVVPIFGTDSLAHLRANLRALAPASRLSDAEMGALGSLDAGLPLYASA